MKSIYLIHLCAKYMYGGRRQKKLSSYLAAFVRLREMFVVVCIST